MCYNRRIGIREGEIKHEMKKLNKKIYSILASLLISFSMGYGGASAAVSEETIEEPVESSMDMVEVSIDPSEIGESYNAPNNLPSVKYLYGNDRYQTSIKISNTGWSSGSDTVILVNGGDTILGIASTPLAKLFNAPIVVTRQNSLDSNIKSELKRLNPKTVYMIGDTSHISKQVSNEVKSITGANMLRISGKYPGEISANIASHIASKKSVNSAYVVSIENGVADALSAVSAKSSDIRPILVVNKNSIGSSASKFIDKYIRNVYYIGGFDSISKSLVSKISGYAQNAGESNRVSGVDRNDTNVKVIKKYFNKSEYPNMVLSTSDNAGLIDTVSAGAYASKIDSPVLFVGRSRLSSYTKKFADEKVAKNIVQIGGSISSSVTSDIRSRLSSATNINSGQSSGNQGANAGSNSGSSTGGGDSLINIVTDGSGNNNTNTDGGNIIGVGLKGKKIVVDAGHGGSDSGAVGVYGAQEKKWTLTTAQSLAEYLRSKGAIVIMTRESDVYPSLPDRVNLSNKKGADFFVSVHFNQGGDPVSGGGLSGTGTEVFTGIGDSANLAASNVLKSIVNYFGMRNRGVKDGTHLYVIRNTVAPAILVEGGFISNIGDYNKMGTDAKLKELGKRIGIGIEAAFSGKRL